MSKFSSVVIAFFLLFLGCHRQAETIIPPEKMVKILADIHLSEAAAQTLSNKQKDSTLNQYYQQIMDIHQVSQADFDTTMMILQRNPKIMHKMYEKIMEELDKEKVGIK